MSEIKALERLTDFVANTSLSKRSIDYLADTYDQIQAEVDANYMRLPVDADGEPIRVGDSVKMKYTDKVFTVQLVGDICFRGQLLGTGTMEIHYSRSCNRVKPRTVEDVLAEIANNVATNMDGKEHYWNPSDFKAEADEIRELLKMVGE